MKAGNAAGESRPWAAEPGQTAWPAGTRDGTRAGGKNGLLTDNCMLTSNPNRIKGRRDRSLSRLPGGVQGVGVAS